MSNKGMSEDMYNFIINNQHKLLYDLDKGLIITPRGTNGSVCSSTGYLKVKVNKKSLLVHQVLAVKYFGETCIGFQVNHKNGCKTDNRKDNLELVTRKENIIHGFNTGLYKNVGTNVPKGSKSNFSKLTDDQVRYIRNSLANNKELSEMFGISERGIRRVKSRNTYIDVV